MNVHILFFMDKLNQFVTNASDDVQSFNQLKFLKQLTNLLIIAFLHEHDPLEEEMKLVTRMYAGRIHTEGDEIGYHILGPSFPSKRDQNVVK
jgi:hypothetical protein